MALAKEVVVNIDKHGNTLTVRWWTGTSYANVKFPGDKFMEAGRKIENPEGLFFFVEEVMHEFLDRKEKDYMEEQMLTGKEEFRIGEDKKVRR
jgi:hypothetical protein